MITYSSLKGRHIFSFNNDDLSVFAKIVWIWKHNPPPIGFNRKPMTRKQEKIIEDIFDHVNYPENYAELLNKKNEQ